MALRTTCLYNDTIIGIESIYTIVDGVKINIPQKVEELRKKVKKKNCIVLAVAVIILS